MGHYCRWSWITDILIINSKSTNFLTFSLGLRLWVRGCSACFSLVYLTLTERNLLKFSKPWKNFGEQFRFRTYLWFYSKCTFAYTKYAQNIVLLSNSSSAMRLRVNNGRVKSCVFHWQLYTQGNHGLRQCLSCWSWTARCNIPQLPHIRRQAIQTGSADLIMCSEGTFSVSISVCKLAS